MFDFLFKKLRRASEAERTTDTVESDALKTTEAEEVVESIPTSAEEPTTPADDLTIIAVIAAAVAAASGRDHSTFRVVSFKRANTNFSYRN